MTDNKYQWVKKIDEYIEPRTGELKQKYQIDGIEGNSGVFVSTNGYDEYIAEIEGRQSIGRYTFEEAAREIAKNSGERDIEKAEEKIYKKLCASAGDSLPFYKNGSLIKHISEWGDKKIVLGSVWEVYWSDLNAWLNIEEDKLYKKFQFPEPQQETESNEQVHEKPLSRSEAQDKAILNYLTSKGHNPLKLPARKSGKAGIKAEVKAALIKDKKTFASVGVFDDAWQRLMDNLEIKEAK